MPFFVERPDKTCHPAGRCRQQRRLLPIEKALLRPSNNLQDHPGRLAPGLSRVIPRTSLIRAFRPIEYDAKV